jgi:hypothetical protein
VVAIPFDRVSPSVHDSLLAPRLRRPVAIPFERVSPSIIKGRPPSGRGDGVAIPFERVSPSVACTPATMTCSPSCRNPLSFGSSLPTLPTPASLPPRRSCCRNPLSFGSSRLTWNKYAYIDFDPHKSQSPLNGSRLPSNATMMDLPGGDVSQSPLARVSLSDGENDEEEDESPSLLTQVTPSNEKHLRRITL